MSATTPPTGTMMQTTLGKIIRRFHEAAFVPSLWPTALDRLAELAGFQTAFLFTVSADHADLAACSAASAKIGLNYRRDGWRSRNDQIKCAQQLGQTRFMTDQEMFASPDLPRIPYYREFLQPAGMSLGCVTTFTNGDLPTAALALHRRAPAAIISADDLARLDEVRPDIHAALVLALSAEMRAWSHRLEVMELIDVATALIDPCGRVLAANTPFKAAEGDLWIWRGRQFSIKDPACHARLSRILAEQDTTNSTRSPLVARGGAATKGWVLQLVPIEGLARDHLLQEGYVLIARSVVERTRSVDGTLLQQFFNLTPAETRIAGLIGQGLGGPAIAARLGLSRETVRSQTKTILAKTGTHRQAELASLICEVGHASHVPPRMQPSSGPDHEAP